MYANNSNRGSSRPYSGHSGRGRIIRRRHSKNFTVIPNGIYDDERLRREAIGLLTFLLSRPANWEIRHDVLQRKFHLSRQKLERLLASLMAASYVTRDADQPRDENMRFTSYAYIVTDVACADVVLPDPAGRRRPVRAAR